MSLAYEIHGSGNASQAIFTFGSYVNPNRTAPSYAFMKTCLDMQARHKLDCDIYYFVANANDWYFSGVRGLGEGFEASVTELKRLKQRYSRTLYVGNSMGGYAALAFGFLTDADRAVAFSPQTRLDKDFQAGIRETRWRESISAVQSTYDCDDFAVDTLIRRHPEAKTRASLFVGKECPQDVAYAQSLAFSPAVKINEIAGEGHDLVHSLRDSGDLIRIIKDQVSTEAAG